jgi:hypothetical protein
MGCKDKKQEKEKSLVPAANFFVNDYIKGQLARLDTAHYSFQKIEIADGFSDTVLIKNAEVRQYAKDFLELPDLSKDNIKDDYKVDHLFDELQNAFIFTYTAKDDHPVKQQQITVEPEIDSTGKNEIRSVYVDLWNTTQESLIRKHMMWEADNFYITTTTETTGQPEKTKTLKIIWSPSEIQNKRSERK